MFVPLDLYLKLNFFESARVYSKNTLFLVIPTKVGILK